MTLQRIDRQTACQQIGGGKATGLSTIDTTGSARVGYTVKSKCDDVNSRNRVEIPRDAILRTTGQLWKVVLAGLVLPFPTTLFGLWLIRRVGPDQTLAELIAGFAILLAAAGAVALSLWSIKCPRCGMRWVRRIVGESDAISALTGFLQMRSCPACGFVAARKDA